MSIRNEIAEALEELESDLIDESGETQKLILPSGLEIPCVPSMESIGDIIIVGGREEEIAIVVRVRKSHFITADLTTITADSDVILADNETPRLRSGKKPQFRGNTYRVLTSEQDPSGAYFRVKLGSAK